MRANRKIKEKRNYALIHKWFVPYTVDFQDYEIGTLNFTEVFQNYA